MKPMSSAQIINHENLMNEQYEEIYDTDNGTHKKDAFHSYVDKILEE
jgi:hypothetical protein